LNINFIIIQFRLRGTVNIDLRYSVQIALRAVRMNSCRHIHREKLEFANINQHIGKIIGRILTVFVHTAERHGLVCGLGFEKPADGKIRISVVYQNRLVHFEDK